MRLAKTSASAQSGAPTPLAGHGRSGSPSLDIGDATVKLIRGKALGEVYKVTIKLLFASEKLLSDR
jgi:hypothetical protein